MKLVRILGLAGLIGIGGAVLVACSSWDDDVQPIPPSLGDATAEASSSGEGGKSTTDGAVGTSDAANDGSDSAAVNGEGGGDLDAGGADASDGAPSGEAGEGGDAYVAEAGDASPDDGG